MPLSSVANVDSGGRIATSSTYSVRVASGFASAIVPMSRAGFAPASTVRAGRASARQCRCEGRPAADPSGRRRSPRRRSRRSRAAPAGDGLEGRGRAAHRDDAILRRVDAEQRRAVAAREAARVGGRSDRRVSRRAVVGQRRVGGGHRAVVGVDAQVVVGVRVDADAIDGRVEVESVRAATEGERGAPLRHGPGEDVHLGHLGVAAVLDQGEQLGGRRPEVHGARRRRLQPGRSA